MRLTRLCKAADSGSVGCPTVYVDEDSGQFVIQGDPLGEADSAGLENLLPGEAAVRIKAEIVLGAVDHYRRARDR